MSKSTEELIREALKKATPGPWTMIDGRVFGYTQTAIEPLICEFNEDSLRDGNNANLIANAPTWLKYLLEQNAALKAERDDFKHGHIMQQAEIKAMREVLEGYAASGLNGAIKVLADLSKEASQ